MSGSLTDPNRVYVKVKWAGFHPHLGALDISIARDSWGFRHARTGAQAKNCAGITAKRETFSVYSPPAPTHHHFHPRLPYHIRKLLLRYKSSGESARTPPLPHHGTHDAWKFDEIYPPRSNLYT